LVFLCNNEPGCPSQREQNFGKIPSATTQKILWKKHLNSAGWQQAGLFFFFPTALLIAWVKEQANLSPQFHWGAFRLCISEWHGLQFQELDAGSLLTIAKKGKYPKSN
jgi:hypothetical protein